MKKLGYIYKYSKSEEKGILVFGTWKEKTTWGTKTIDTPVLFTASDLLSEVTSGCLVYFDLNDRKVSNIERASLSNFKVDFINSIVRCGQQESEYSFYKYNTNISFEYLDTIIIPEEKKSNSKQIKKHQKKISFLTILTIF